jgi:hypothetical protein
MTLRAFSPKRITMTPPATSPRPSNSTIPRRMSEPSTTWAMSRTSTGVPALLPTTIDWMSSTDLM